MSEAGGDLAELPEEVRARVLALTADVLPAVPRVPPALRKVAAFAPPRRARLGATAIAAALAADSDFRERVAAQLRPATDASGPHDDVQLAAEAWLRRDDDWCDQLADALERLSQRDPAPELTAAEVERWERKARTAEENLRAARDRHRDEVAELKAENTKLRRRLGEARSALKDALASAESAVSAAAEAERRAESAASAQDRELRALRSQVERLEGDAQAGRRAARAERDDATIRARLLLDTVIDAATGLRRELSLPSLPGTPAERVEAGLADAAPVAGTTSAPASPELLEQWLGLPRARLIVDGYNVTKSAWGSSSLEAQRARLLGVLAPLVARTGAETTVVFDAASSATRPVLNTPRGVRVVFSPEGVIADDVIRDLVAAEPQGRVVVVVTSDQALARGVSMEGVRVVPARVLIDVVSRLG